MCWAEGLSSKPWRAGAVGAAGAFSGGFGTKDGDKSQERLLAGKAWEGAKGLGSVQVAQGLEGFGGMGRAQQGSGMQLKEWLDSSENTNPRETKLILGLTEGREQELKGE